MFQVPEELHTVMGDEPLSWPCLVVCADHKGPMQVAGEVRSVRLLLAGAVGLQRIGSRPGSSNHLLPEANAIEPHSKPLCVEKVLSRMSHLYKYDIYTMYSS